MKAGGYVSRNVVLTTNKMRTNIRRMPYLEFLRCFDLKDEPCFNYYKNKYDCGAIMGKIDSSNQTKMSFLSAIATVFVGILLTYN
ncbi:uncharacterized protein LOC128249831 isoform X2 [Octopus bimaculoides]|uniref:uncharacterized protein LOC128249831 isoform X2 n=1 Tax=Octopus bimaculoides TaxID=37653 RepID=UPI0022E786DB|nr:uncharacterized protein LOC128249831 isoform X2 [Octopus bimaculoides]